MPKIAYLKLRNLILNKRKLFFSKTRKSKDFKRHLQKRKLLTNRLEKNYPILKKLTSLPKIEWKTPWPKKKSSKKKTENIFTKFKI